MATMIGNDDGGIDNNINTIASSLAEIRSLGIVKSGATSTEFQILVSLSGNTYKITGIGFGSPNTFGFPTVGTVTGYALIFGQTEQLAITNFSLPVQDLLLYINNNNAAGLINAIFSGDDIITAPGLWSGDILHGYDGNDQIAPGGGSDEVYGGAGNDTIIITDTSAGSVLDGGIGFDTLSVSGMSNTIAPGSSKLLDFSGSTVSGFEKIVFEGSQSVVAVFAHSVLGSGLPFDAVVQGSSSPSDRLLFFAGASGAYSLAAANFSFVNWGAEDYLELWAPNSSSPYTLIGSNFKDRLVGGFGADSLSGNAGNDVLAGQSGNDTLNGGDGNDALYGGAGNDALNGGAGVDIAIYSESASGVSVSLASMGPQNTLGQGFDALNSIENLSGSAFADQLTGDSGSNVILGEGGNDTLTGGAGGDDLDGGSGLDTASYASSGSGVVVQLSAGSIYGGDAEGDTLTSIENVTGSGFGDNLRGDAQINVLDGLGGNDTLDGGLGADTLRAGDGDDYIYFDEQDLSGGQVRGGTGYDWIYNVTAGPLAGLLVVNLATLEAEGYYGSNGAEQVNASGVATSVTLYGNGGSDQLTGGSGDDYIYFDAADLAGGSIAGGAGYDWAFLNEQIGVSLNLATTGFEGAYGRDGADNFNASAKTSSVTLYGNGGADTLTGGSGDDYIYFDALDLSGGSIIGGAGYDWAILNEQVGVSLILAARGFEGAYGRDGNDTFDASGVATSVTLYGNGGADTLIGGSGGDYIYFDSADLASGSISGGAGYDYAIFNELGVGATLNLTATGFEGAVGRNGNDVFTAAGAVSSVSLYGYEGNDQLTGGAGSDYLYGDIGNDTLTGGAGTDYFITYTGWGADTLTDFEQGIDRVVMSVSGLTAFSQLTITQSGADALVTFGANSLRFSNTSATSIDVSDFLNLANALPAMLSGDRVEEVGPATLPDIGVQGDGGESLMAADVASLVDETHQGVGYAPSSVSTDIYQPWVASIGQDDDIFSLLDGLTVEAGFGMEAALPSGGFDALGDLDPSQPPAPVVDHSGAWMFGV